MLLIIQKLCDQTLLLGNKFFVVKSAEIRRNSKPKVTEHGTTKTNHTMTSDQHKDAAQNSESKYPRYLAKLVMQQELKFGHYQEKSEVDSGKFWTAATLPYQNWFARN